MAETYLFFIDDTGTNGHDNFVLRGGFLIKVADYICLYKNFVQLKEAYQLGSQEIKWSDLTSAIRLKNKNPKVTFSRKKSYFYLERFSVEELKEITIKIFKIIENVVGFA